MLLVVCLLAFLLFPTNLSDITPDHHHPRTTQHLIPPSHIPWFYCFLTHMCRSVVCHCAQPPHTIPHLSFLRSFIHSSSSSAARLVCVICTSLCSCLRLQKICNDVRSRLYAIATNRQTTSNAGYSSCVLVPTEKKQRNHHEY